MENNLIPLGIDAGNGAFKLFGAPGGLAGTRLTGFHQWNAKDALNARPAQAESSFADRE